MPTGDGCGFEVIWCCKHRIAALSLEQISPDGPATEGVSAPGIVDGNAGRGHARGVDGNGRIVKSRAEGHHVVGCESARCCPVQPWLVSRVGVPRAIGCSLPEQYGALGNRREGKVINGQTSLGTRVIHVIPAEHEAI